MFRSFILNKSSKKYLLLIILSLAFLLRFYGLGSNPPSLTWDEAAWGYNAYSLGIDGKDEFGRFLPHDYLESFGDFKPPVYAYLAVIPVKIFGLNEFATRFPSALFGFLTVFVTYFLVKRIFGSNRDEENNKKAEILALISSLILAISPWHVNLSRAAFEANIATFFIATGVWLFLEGVTSKKYLLMLSIISFALSIYTFNTARIVTPILLIFLSFFFFKKFLKMKKMAFLSFSIGFIILLPTLRFLLSPNASLRFKEVNIFSDPLVVSESNQEIENDLNAPWSKLIHNRRVKYSILYVRHYLDNLNPDFLFIKGDGNPKFSTQDVGELYLWEFPFLIVGFFYLLKRKEGFWWLVPIWLAFGIIPAAMARETPHALRIETTLPTFQILTAYGIFAVFKKILSLKLTFFNLKVKNIVLGVFLLIILFNLSYYLHGYYAHYPREYSGEWQYGYKESINYVKSTEEKFDQIVTTDALGRPYMYYLFYTKTDPRIFRKEAKIKRDQYGFVTVESFGKYYFTRDFDKVKKKTRKVLYIEQEPRGLPTKARLMKTFYLLNNEPILNAYVL